MGSIDLVEEYLNKWCSWAARSRIEEIVRLGRTIKNHASGIIGAIKSGINNGVVEGLNNKIRTAFKRGEIMPTCKDCKFFEPIDETKGNCFGHEVPADMDVEKCPAKAFQPKE